MLAVGKVRTSSVHRVPTLVWEGGRALGLGGLLAEPEGDEPRWTLRRRAVANALRAVAPEARVLVVATPEGRPGELMGLQALDVAAEANPGLMRTVRRASPDAPARLRHLDPPLAEAEAASREIDSLWAAALARAEPGHGTRRPAGPGAGAGPGHGAPRASAACSGASPARRTAAGDVLLAHLLAAAPPLCDPDVPARVGEWVDAVADGTLGRGPTPWPGPGPCSAGRAVGPGAGGAPEEGRVLAHCPDCDGPMRPRPGEGRSRQLVRLRVRLPPPPPGRPCSPCPGATLPGVQRAARPRGRRAPAAVPGPGRLPEEWEAARAP